MNLHPFGKVLMAAGAVIFLAGLLIMFSHKIPFLGKMPGDILIKKENFTFYFPIVTSILLSILLSLAFFVFRYFKR
jgi:hypothetical protein